jgi:uncharacterized membrane protein
VGWLLAHLRDKLLAGVLAAAPVVILLVAALWIENNTRQVADTLGVSFPGIGFLIVLVVCYVLGLAVTSFLGRFFLGLGDAIIQRVPGLNQIYRVWKDVLVVSPDQKGMFNQVVLIPQAGHSGQVGFTSGRTLPGDPENICVFVPNLPNPLSGRLVVARRDTCIVLPISVEEAFKFLLSTGNYLPPQLRGYAGAPSHSPPPP